MRAINHALTGALLGLMVDQPVVAGLSSVASHFICDMIPHYGANLPEDQEYKSKLFRHALYIDALLCFLLVIVLAVLHPTRWLQAAVCAFLAAAPDFLAFKRYISVLHGQKDHKGTYARFAGGIQWFERPIGIAVEAAWFIAALILLIPIVR